MTWPLELRNNDCTPLTLPLALFGGYGSSIRKTTISYLATRTEVNSARKQEETIGNPMASLQVWPLLPVLVGPGPFDKGDQ